MPLSRLVMRNEGLRSPKAIAFIKINKRFLQDILNNLVYSYSFGNPTRGSLNPSKTCKEFLLNLKEVKN